jgi:hypothetical protein
MAKSGSLCVTTAVTNIFRLPSKVAGKDPKKGGSWWICTNPRCGETDSYFHRSSSAWPNSVRPGSRHATASKSSIFGEFTPLAIGRSWHLNARGCPIPVINLLRVNYLYSPFINDKLISNY